MTFYVVLEFLLKLVGGIDLLPGLSGWLLSKVSVLRFKLMGMKMVLSTTNGNYNSQDTWCFEVQISRHAFINLVNYQIQIDYKR